MPGVEVTTSVKAGAGDPIRALSSQYFVAGLATKGRTTVAVACDSMKAFIDEYGPRASYGNLYDDVESYFAEGGTRVVALRVVGASATKGVLALVDRAGSPLSTVTLTAISGGDWSSSVEVSVADGAIANTVTINVVYLRGTPAEVRETYTNVGPTPTAIVEAINATSRLVVATDNASATSAPNNRPAVLAFTALSAGADDRAAVDAAAMTGALAKFTGDYGPGAVGLPGWDVDDVAAGQLAHCVTFRRVAILAGLAADSTSTIKTSADGVLGDAGSDGAMIAWPWVKAPNGTGGTRTIPPHGYVAGVRARAHQVAGPWQWPCGEFAAARFIVDTATPVDKAIGDDLNSRHVSAIRTIGGRVRLYGWRSLAADEVNFYSLAGRDTLNSLAYDAELELEPVVFRSIDSKGVTVALAESLLVGIAQGYADRGGLFPLGDDPGYQVDVVATPGARRIDGSLSVRLAEAAELVRVAISKVAADSAL